MLLLQTLSLSLTSFVWVLPLCYWLHTPTQQCTSIYPFERTFSPVCSRGNFSFSQTYRFHFRMITPFGCSINMNECRAHIHATNILSKQCNESTEIVSLKHTRRASLRKKEQRKKNVLFALLSGTLHSFMLEMVQCNWLVDLLHCRTNNERNTEKKSACQLMFAPTNFISIKIFN